MCHKTPSSRRLFAGLFAMYVVLVAVGCEGGGTKMYTLSGTVTLDGQAVPDGQITFRDAKNGKAFVGPIKDGKYEVKAEPGDMRVEIVAARVVPGKFDTTTNPGVSEPVSEMYIPKQYNVETTLLAKVDGNATLPFELKSAGKK